MIGAVDNGKRAADAWEGPAHGQMGATHIGMPQQRLNRTKMVRTARNQRKDVLLLATPNLGVHEGITEQSVCADSG